MKIGVFGGAFNPVHIGHVKLLEVLDNEINFDKILIIPSKQSPHKSSDGLIDSKYRVEMLKIAFSQYNKATISDIELKREGKSYTVDTLKQLKGEYLTDELFLICGSDMFLTLHDWREPIEIFKNAVICTALRGDVDDEVMFTQNEMLKNLGAETVLVNKRIKPVSSTIIREGLKNGQDVHELLPSGVYDYILQNGIYRE